MKAPTLLLCVLPAASGFIPSPVVVSRTSLPDRRQQRATVAQVATVAIDAPRTLPKGKRIVRRKKRQPSQPKHVDTTNAPVTVGMHNIGGRETVEREGRLERRAAVVPAGGVCNSSDTLLAGVQQWSRPKYGLHGLSFLTRDCTPAL